MKKIPQKRHIENTVKALRSKYGIEGSLTKPDFYRVCEGEGIIIDEHADVKAFFEKWRFLPGFCIFGVIALRCLWDEVFEPAAAAYILGRLQLGNGAGSVPSKKEYFNDPKAMQAGYFSFLLTGEALYGN